MSTTMKLAAGSAFPSVSVPRLGGGELTPASGKGWRLFVIYRGKHCPLCKIYLRTLDGMIEDFAAASVSISVASGDPEEKAAADVAEHGWRFPLGYPRLSSPDGVHGKSQAKEWGKAARAAGRGPSSFWGQPDRGEARRREA
jgi:peroxiredoxin